MSIVTEAGALALTIERDLAGYIALQNRHCYDFTLPTVGQLYDYLFAADGIYLRALRPGLHVLLKVSDVEIRGLMTLADSIPFKKIYPVEFALPRVPAAYVQTMLDRSISTCVEKNEPTEALFHLIWNEEEDRWRLDKPAQEASGASVRPLHDGAGSSYQLATIELHSHHQMEAFFSGTDDEDEQGFRIYAVIGEIFTEPKILVRVGCFGHFLQIPAETVFELPSSIKDNHQEEPDFCRDALIKSAEIRHSISAT